MITKNPDIALHLRVLLAVHKRRPAEVARRAGIDIATMSRFLSGNQSPSASTLRRVEDAILRREVVS